MAPILGIYASSITPSYVGAYESIATATAVGGSGTTITFTNIPQTYKHLQVRCLTATYDGNQRSMLMYMNNSQASDYSAHTLRSDGTTVSTSADTSQQWNMLFSGGYYGIAGATNVWAPMIIDILDYTNTSNYKTTRAIGGWNNNTSGGQLYLGSANWRSTAAVSRLDFITTYASGWRAGSTFALYGIKG